MIKTHLFVSKPNEYGGYNSDTLCGREAYVADQNADADGSKVTCKICLGIMADPKNWRHRKWLK